jgi:lysyl endopeptidase
MKSNRLSRFGVSGLIALFLFARAAIATPAEDVLNVNLNPLIDKAAQYPTRFAVDIPHSVSTADAGTWTQSGTRSTWTYSMRIPAAASMSFHAPKASLPAGAILTVTGETGVSTRYQARDVARSGLWSRPTPGDSLRLTLSVSTAQQAQTVLEIQSFQAGYRSLGPGVPDNAHYHEIRQKTGLLSCALNYSCEATSANQGPAHATVALLIANVGQCSGTLVNDTSGDSRPYVLTARHCENDKLGGGDPGAAANVTVYWDAVTPCGSALGSIYDGNAITQTGATTLVEQQDAWLIQLDAPPAASDAYFAGWDATGGIFSGGYGIHHALSYDKQYVDWYGQPILQTIPGASLGVTYSSNFLGVVNASGNIGPGASGSALFDPANNAVGSLTLGEPSDGAGSDGVCPVTPLQAPTAANFVGSYTSLAAVWGSTADTTSTTGSATLQSVLDAAKTGKLLVNGSGYIPVTLNISQDSPLTGQTVTLTWNATGAQSCTASGGLGGDGWTGTLSDSGSVMLTEQSGGAVTYSLSCTGAGAAGSTSLTVTWQLVPGSVALTGSGPTVSAGSPVLLQWGSNVEPCTASGGTSGDGWAGSKATSGSQSVLASTLGTVTYTLACGTGERAGSAQYAITVIAPSVSTITGDANDLRIGQPVNIQFSAGGSCTASGGAPGDGWAGPLSTASRSLTEAAAGTYTYTITCTGAGATANLSASKSLSLTFTNAAPAASLTASPTPVEVYSDPGVTGFLNLAWTSNVRPCAITYAGPGNIQGTDTGVDLAAGLPSGTGGDDQAVAGAYVYTLTCGTGQNEAQSTASVTWFTNAPAVTLSANNPLPQGVPTSIGWTSNVYPCTGTGGVSGDGWAGGPRSAVGGQSVTESANGSVTFAISCGTGAQTAHAQVTTTVVTPEVAIIANASSLPVNGDLILNWTGDFSPCTSSINGGQGWGTVLPMTGGVQTSEEIAGTYTYTISCAGAQASTQVTFTGSLATLAASVSSVSVGTEVTLTWSSPIYFTGCTPGGGSSGDGWSGSVGTSGTQNVTSTTAGTITYSIGCNSQYGVSSAQTQVTYTPAATTDPPTPTPQVTLSTSKSSQTVGSPVTLSWASQNADGCSATGGSGSDGWSGSLALSGDTSVTETDAGSFSYGITCTGAPPAATAKAQVDFTDQSVTVSSSSSSGGKSGGGALDPLWLVLLGVSMCRRAHRRLTVRGNAESLIGSGSEAVRFSA